MKLLIILVFIAVLASLGSGLFFLVKDRGESKRMVNALTLRVALSVMLFVLLLGSWLSGWIQIPS
ncbi:MAG: twin transmembrane helix small protein [Planctomycetales bacterium]|nr:twin transmembrane helix small protein [Planctomycetales bacterium]